MVGTQKQVHPQGVSEYMLRDEDMVEKEWKEALRIVEAYDKMVGEWIKLLNQGRKYEIKLLAARQLAMRAMAKADRA